MALEHNPITSKSCPSHTVHVWMAGEIDDARRWLRQEAARRGLCVSISPVDYIYTGGEEAGFRLTLINYPRFPAEPDQIYETARDLARGLVRELGQSSYTIEGPDFTDYFSRREAAE